jgi:O-antigen/teichoic acid export membrane protein
VLDAGLLRRAGWGIGDQVLSSLSNFLVGLLVARSVDLATFGAFSLAFSAYLIAVSVSRAFPMSPLAIRYAAADRASFGRAAAAATGTALAGGIAAGAILVAIAAITGGALSQAFLALGITLPGLLLQDAWRSTFFASGRGRHAFLNDLVWVAIEVPALVIILATTSGSILALVAAWGGSACVAAVVGILQARVLPAPLRARAWWREHDDIASRFIAEAIARVASGQLMGYGVGAVTGLGAVGALRAGQLLFGPIQLVFYGVNQMAVPEASRAAAISLARLRRAAVVAAGLLALGAGAWTLVVLILPAAVGEAILEEAWAPARDLAVPIGLTFVAGMLGFGGELGLRALAAAGRLLRVTIITSVLTLVLGVAGAAWGGASGCAWALFAVAVIGGLLLWLEYDRAEAERSVDPTPGHAAA